MVPNEERVSNEKKNLNRLAGEFLVASRLTQRGYMVALQWGNTIGYDVLVFDKTEKVAYLEVKSTASNPKRWILQAKYAHPERDAIRLDRRFVCCVDLTVSQTAPHVYVFPAQVVAKGLHYFYAQGFADSPSYMLALHAKPRGRTGEAGIATVGEHIEAAKYLDRFDLLNVAAVSK
jgi:hypothetical protein